MWSSLHWEMVGKIDTYLLGVCIACRLGNTGHDCLFSNLFTEWNQWQWALQSCNNYFIQIICNCLIGFCWFQNVCWNVMSAGLECLVNFILFKMPRCVRLSSCIWKSPRPLTYSITGQSCFDYFHLFNIVCFECVGMRFDFAAILLLSIV